MADTEVSKEVPTVAVVEKKCGLDVSSNEDLPEPDCNGAHKHNQANDPDNSYVFVIGADGFSDDAVPNKDAVVEGSSVLPEPEAAVEDQGAKLGAQDEKLDVANGEVCKPLNDGENGNVELGNGDPPNSCENGDEVQVPVADSLEELNGEAESSVEAEVKQVEDSSGKLDSSAEAAIEMVVDQNGETESLVESEIKQVEDPSGKIDSSAEAAIEMVVDQNGKDESLVEAEIKQVEELSGELDSSSEAAIEMVVDQNGKAESLVEAEIEQVEDPSGTTENPAEVAAEMIVDQNGKSEIMVETEIKQVEDLNRTTEISAEASIGDQNETTQSLPEAEIKQVEDPNDKIDSLAEAAIETVGDQREKSEGVTNSVEEKVEDLVESESSPGLVESHESQVEASELVEESRENGANDACVDQNNLSATDMQARQGSQHAVVDAVDCESQDARAEGEDEVKLEGEVVEKVDPEVPSATSLESDQESYSNGNIEISAEAGIEKVSDEKEEVEGVAKAEQEKVEDLIKSESSSPVENQESQVEALELVLESTENGESNNMLAHIDKSGNSNDEYEDQINSGAVESSVVDAVERGLQDVSVKEVDEVKLSKEVVENVELEASLADSLDSVQESHPINNTEEMLEKEAMKASDVDLIENKKCDIAVGNNVEGALGQMDETKIVVSSTDLHVEGKNEDLSVSRVDDDTHPDTNGVTHETMQSETKIEPSVPTQISVNSNAREIQTEIEVSNAENIEAVSSPPVDSPKSEIIENGLKETSLGSEIMLGTVVCTESEPTFPSGEAQAETEISSGKVEVADGSAATSDVKLVPETDVHNLSVMSNGETANDDNEGATKEVENLEDNGAAGSSNEKLHVQENDDTGKSHINSVSVASQESSSAIMINGGEETSIKAKTKPFNFLIRVPRIDDESLREKIRLAKLHVDEKTKIRDAIQVQIQEIRANSQIHGVDYEYAKNEGRNARKLVRSKRMEIDSLMSVINKAKNALSVDDIDSQIYNMEHMIQHETRPLKEEKQLIREIKQLKQLREQLCSNMGSQDEIRQALEQREEAEERVKILKKELDVLKNSVAKAEAASVQAERKYDDQNKKVKELQAQFRAANDVRQEAYVEWQNLRKELSNKNAHFFKYKDDAAVANNHAFSRDPEALYRLCTNHVENFMELWNTNEEFRRDYAKFNTRSTVRRLGTLDGRSLGPDEEPPVLPSYVDDRANRMHSRSAKVNSAPQIPIPEPKLETTAKDVTPDDKPTKKVTEHKSQKVTIAAPTEKPVVLENGVVTVSDRDVNFEVVVHEEEPKKSKEEIELLKKEEEKRREKAEAEMKERRRLEGLEKAKEARERKKRQAEKLQMRAELKTQKEAEQKEKEREKRLRKKERKRAGGTDVNDMNNNNESTPTSESPIDIVKDKEVKEASTVVTAKKPPQKKPWLFSKQSKTKSAVPPPLRNRNKKKWQQWMWVGMTCLVILVLFWLGNMGIFANINLRRRSPIH